MWPMEDSTMKSGPSRPLMVRALAGDSTMTSALPMGGPFAINPSFRSVRMVEQGCGSATRLSRAACGTRSLT